MGKKGHSEEKILRVLREAESGDTIVDGSSLWNWALHRHRCISRSRANASGESRTVAFRFTLGGEQVSGLAGPWDA